MQIPNTEEHPGIVRGLNSTPGCNPLLMKCGDVNALMARVAKRRYRIGVALVSDEENMMSKLKK